MTKQINNNLEESKCSFELSKLLKMKVCKVKSKYWYNGQGKLEICIANWDFHTNNTSNAEDGMSFGYTCISHALAIEWIRVNFDINIAVVQDWIIRQEEAFKAYSVIIEHYDEPIEEYVSLMKFETPQEACEAALLHTLKELI